MQNAGLDETQAGIKIARRNISSVQSLSHVRPCADPTDGSPPGSPVPGQLVFLPVQRFS